MCLLQAELGSYKGCFMFDLYPLIETLGVDCTYPISSLDLFHQSLIVFLVCIHFLIIHFHYFAFAI